MKKLYFYLAFLFVLTLVYSCKRTNPNNVSPRPSTDEFILSFGSCNNQNLKNNMWPEILKNKADVFVWGGDIIYADTHDMKFMKKNYELQKKDSSYLDFTKKVEVIGTWDDHDYGSNDGGKEYDKKDSVQQIFLDFFNIDKSDPRRKKQGVYFSKKYDIGQNSVNIILLDLRYFRDSLTKDPSGEKRYIPNKYGEGSMLGKKQWQWLKNELTYSKSDYNILISSIQFLSFQHGFESWGNMPHEVDKLKNLIVDSNAKGVIILSGDRHIAEISKDSISKMNYPLIDVTSSGLTHSYTAYSGELNKYRVTDVVANKNFGILKFDFAHHKVLIEIRGENNQLFTSYTQKY